MLKSHICKCDHCENYRVIPGVAANQILDAYLFSLLAIAIGYVTCDGGNYFKRKALLIIAASARLSPVFPECSKDFNPEGNVIPLNGNPFLKLFYRASQWIMATFTSCQPDEDALRVKAWWNRSSGDAAISTSKRAGAERKVFHTWVPNGSFQSFREFLITIRLPALRAFL